MDNQYVFKHFFSEREVYDELSDFYNRRNYRFECQTEEDKDKSIEILEKYGFEVVVVEDYSEYVVKIHKFKKHSAILRESVANEYLGEDRIFLMKDKFSVERALSEGAEQYSNDIVF